MSVGDRMKRTRRKCAWGALGIILGLPLLSVDNAYADLVRYSYTTGTGEQVATEPGVGFINPASTVSFMVSGGIDRKLRVTVTPNGSSAPTFIKESTRVLGANDVITYNGKSYYGEEFLSPKLADGKYSVRTDILSSTGAIVQSDNNSLVIDTKGPVAGTFAPRPYTWGTPVLTGDVWKLGLAAADAATYSTFVLSGFSDTSGISNVTARVYRATGELYKAQNVLFSEDTKTASIQYRTNFFPNSDLDEVFGVDFVITDKAGNVTATNRQKVMFDNIGNAPTEPFAVYDPDNTATLAPGLKGFVPYVPGYAVKTNPIRLAWKIPKTNWNDYRLGGLRFQNSFGENTVVGTDDTFVYLVGSLPFRAEDTNYIRFFNYGEWGSQGTIRYDLVLHPNAPKTPVIKLVEYYFSDKGWMNYSGRIVRPEELPIKVTKVRYTVEARPFAQVATHLGTCTIPAGQTQCEIAIDTTLAKGTTGYMHNQAVLKSADGALSASGQWANVWWNDLYYPVLSYTYNAAEMILTLKVQQPHQGDYNNYLAHKTAWIENKSGAQLPVTKKLTSSNGGNFEYEFDLKTLPEGTQEIVGAASENLGAVSRIPLFTVESDRKSPVIAVSKGASETIDTLDKISFTVTDDKDPAPKIVSVNLTGGPANESIALSYRKINATTYGLEYPILFPSLAAGETYTLTVTAQDAQKNTGTGATTFLYGPPMAGIIDHDKGLINIPAVPTEFKRKDGSVLINSQQLKLADGTPVSGVYDLLATVRSDAVTPLRISGFTVNPGSTVMLGQLNFTSTGGKISIPVVPVTPGAVGSNSLIISTSAPNSPVVYANITTWLPTVSLAVNDDKPVQAMTTVSATLEQAAGNTCQVTTSPEVAKSADPILAPVCLLEWTSIPRGLKQTDVAGTLHPMTQLTGRALDVGRQKIGYSLSLYNKGTEKVLLTSSEQFLDVQSTVASATFSQSLQGKPVTRAIDLISVTMSQLTGPRCRITGDEAIAREAGVAGTSLTCLIQFTAVPEGLKIKSLDPLELAGKLPRAGEQSIRWTASVFDASGTKLTLEQGQSTIQVINPDVTTSLEFKVNEGSQATVTPADSHPDAWQSKTYSVLSDPEHGSVVPTASGFTYTPAEGYVGSDGFTYKVLDASGMAVEGAAHVLVEKYNYAPTFASVVIQGREGKLSDPVVPTVQDRNLWDSHSYAVTQAPQNGIIVVLGDRLAYAPAPGFYGDDSFKFTATDQAGLAIEGNGVVKVDQYNLPPLSISPNEVKAYVGIGGAATLTVTDPNRWDSHVFEVIRQPGHGVVTLEGARMRFQTTGASDTSVLIRAIDQNGLYVDQNIDLKLIPMPRGNNRIRMGAPISQVLASPE
ncbi:DUF4165 domain-containing protein [Pseudomonas sp. S1(2024)]|uniref:DUF4165 domain-containing protein n=1 Tax=Pseudomonas sp. S1(2024) TaxID=3390191 RepID=UPI00397B5182